MKKIYFVLFAILCTIIFACTDNLTSTELDSNQNSSTGELKVFVKQSRLFSPVISEISWTVELVDEENNAYSSKETNGYFLFSNLKLGTYTVNASGKDSLGVERFWGSITINFDSAKPLEVFVPVSASKNPNSDITSTGFTTITMDMSDELLDILYSMGEGVFLEARLFGIDDTNTDLDVSTNFADVTYNDNLEIESIDIFDNQTVNFVNFLQETKTETKDIPTGYYNLSFVGLEDYGYSIKLKDNLVEIGDGLTTNIVLTQNDYHLVKNYETYLFVDNSENANDENSDEMVFGKTLSNPIGFSKLTVEDFIDNELIYLLSDVDFVYDTETKNLYPNLRRFSGTISSFGSTVRTICADIEDYDLISLCDGTTLRNVKLSGPNGFYVNNLIVDETVIFDCEMGADSPCVQLSKTSNLQIGENFSGNLCLSLSGEWKLGDAVIQFENGKPENSNFYIDSECGNSSGQKYSAMFYIDDSGKLAEYTDDFTSFAWFDTMPCLVTKTQAKNNTYTSIYENQVSDDTVLYGYTGISTYDENGTWYFIANGSDASVNTVSSLYKVSASTEYTDSVTAKRIEVSIPDLTYEVNLSYVTAMDYDNGKLYMGFYDADCLNLCVIETSNGIGYLTSAEFKQVSNLTALLVHGDNVYMATKNPTADNSGITHSAIWQLTLELTENGYILSPAQTYTDDSGADCPVPYYLTQNDEFLTITDDLSGYSNLPAPTFRITDLYSDGISVYGLLANYIETYEINANGNVYMRGSVFKLQENTTTVNAFHYGLRNSFAIEDIPVAKQYFILPRKIVGIMNKKLIIADDGMIPDRTDCNLDRFILFDLDGTLSEKIDVNIDFKTSGTSSVFATDSLF